MQEKRGKQGKRNIVDKAYGKVEILPSIQRPIDMEYERRKTDRRKMDDERRSASLLKEYEYADPKPY